ncbi:MAG TPA: hypothetical protein VGK73_03210 [Polyangiaceae bacterium]
MAEMRGAFRVCRNQLVGRNPRAAGTVRLQLFVDCDGSVKSIHAEGNGVDDEALRCVIETARRGQFDAPAAGSAEVRVPVTFDPERPDAGSAVDAADPADAATSTDTGAAADAGDAGVGDTADAGHTEDAGAAAGANPADAGAPGDAGVLP